MLCYFQFDLAINNPLKAPKHHVRMHHSHYNVMYMYIHNVWYMYMDVRTCMYGVRLAPSMFLFATVSVCIIFMKLQAKAALWLKPNLYVKFWQEVIVLTSETTP